MAGNKVTNMNDHQIFKLIATFTQNNTTSSWFSLTLPAYNRKYKRILCVIALHMSSVTGDL